MEKKDKNEEIQSRREFFKNAARKALPFLGIVALVNLPTNAKPTKEKVTDCGSSCTNGCVSCIGSCEKSCTGSCQGSCSGGCAGSCLHGCNNSCAGTCTLTCSNYCATSNSR